MRFSPKKLLLLTGLAAMALSFAACGKKDAAKSSEGSSAAESSRRNPPEGAEELR